LLALALEVFRPAVSPQSKRKVVRPLSSFEPSSEAPGRRCLVSPRRRSHDSMRSASHELLRPSSVRMQASRIIARFHPDSIPLRPFSDPWGLDPRKHLRPCCMPLTLMGFHRPELFPVSQLFPARHQAIPSRPFLRRIRRCFARALRAFCQLSVRSLHWSIASRGGPMLSSAFIASTALRALGV